MTFKTVCIFYKKFTEKPYSSFGFTTLASGISSRFRKNPLETTKKSIISIDDKIKEEKQKYDINSEATKMSV